MISLKHNIDDIQIKIESFHDKKPISYLVLDDFITPEFFQECEDVILDTGFNVLQHDVGENRKNKTIFIRGDIVSKLHDFFSSGEFNSYLSKIFGQQCEREFYISQEQILERCGSKGIICQLYEDSDCFGWHVDGYEKGISLGAFTYYLGGYNGDWEREYGGILELGTGDWGNISAYKEILPKKNRIVFIIYSDSAYHRVTPNVSSLPRISLQSTIIKNKGKY